MFSRETVLILKWQKLPEKLRDHVTDYRRFVNGVILPLLSEFQPSGEETWSANLQESNFRQYYTDQRDRNNYTKSFEEFLDDYGLCIEWWLKDQDIDLTDVTRILIDVRW